MVAVFVAPIALASAQAAASSFDALAGRVRVGQEVRVTDRAGREVRGRFQRRSGDTLVLKAHGVGSFAASDVRARALAIAIPSRTARSQVS